jgi:hypothetical protein
LSERILREAEVNQTIINESHGKDVLYGSEVCLMHFDSKSFIKGNNDCAQTNKVGYDCQLSKWFSDSMVFKIQPRYKSRQEGELIQYGDNLIFFNVKYTTYLSFTTEIMLPHDKAYEASDNNPYRLKQYIIDPAEPTHNRYRVYLSQEAESAWRLTLFRYSGLSPDLILGNDLITLKHTELEGYLSADLAYDLPTPEIFVRNYDGEFKTEESSLMHVWEIEHMENEEKGKEFVLEENHDDTGYSNHKRSKPFRLRHFASGMLLRTYKKEGEHINYLTLDSPHEGLRQKTSFSRIISQPILRHINHMQADNSYYLLIKESLAGNENDPLFIKCQSGVKLNRKVIKERFNRLPADSKKYFTPLEENELSEDRKVNKF